MSDLLLQLGENPRARQMIKRLGLPIPMPQALRRARGPQEDRPLADRKVAVGFAPGAQLAAAVARTLCEAGADPLVRGDEAALAAFKEPGEAFGRRAQALGTNGALEGLEVEALVFDGSGIQDPSGLRELYQFFHSLVGAVGKNGRVVVLGRPADRLMEAPAAAAQAGLEGFVRSLAKEIGKKGATANVVFVESGAEARVPGVLRFLLSERSAFVTGQPFVVSAMAADGAEVQWTRPLEGKVALVTGAARGIGEATARLLAAEGARVLCLDRPGDDELVSRVAREIGGSVLLVDVMDPEAPERVAAGIKAKTGQVDVVVHNAGVTRDKTLAKMSPEAWDQAVEINLGAVTRITDRLLSESLVRDGGRIICLSSVAGIAGNVGQTNYAASKAGIIGFVRALADQVAERGITVNAIAPGFIETRLTRAIPVMIREVGRRLAALGQGGLPEDVGQAITFLATPSSQGLTGRVVRVCGGAFIGA